MFPLTEEDNIQLDVTETEGDVEHALTHWKWFWSWICNDTHLPLNNSYKNLISPWVLFILPPQDSFTWFRAFLARVFILHTYFKTQQTLSSLIFWKQDQNVHLSALLPTSFLHLCYFSQENKICNCFLLCQMSWAILHQRYYNPPTPQSALLLETNHLISLTDYSNFFNLLAKSEVQGLRVQLKHKCSGSCSACAKVLCCSAPTILWELQSSLAHLHRLLMPGIKVILWGKRIRVDSPTARQQNMHEQTYSGRGPYA